VKRQISFLFISFLLLNSYSAFYGMLMMLDAGLETIFNCERPKEAPVLKDFQADVLVEHILPFLQKKDLVKYRRVSKFFKEAIDTLFGEKLQKYKATLERQKQQKRQKAAEKAAARRRRFLEGMEAVILDK